jgi:hypothetical protein
MPIRFFHVGSSFLSIFLAALTYTALLIAPSCECRVEDASGKPVINIDDFFQLPADMVEHFPLLQSSENLQKSTAFAHISKDKNTWSTHRSSRSVTIPTAHTELSFFYQNPQTGTVTKVHNSYETVADIVYLEHLHSILHVECDHNSTLSITFNASLSPTAPGLRFGLKRSHFTNYTKISGGQSFFCHSSNVIGTTISRHVIEVTSYAEDEATGFLSSITIETSPALQESLYNTNADIFVNGSFVLIPKTALRLNVNSTRLNWHVYLRKMHDSRKAVQSRTSASLRNSDCGGDGVALQCKFASIKTGFNAEVRYQKSNLFYLQR